MKTYLHHYNFVAVVKTLVHHTPYLTVESFPRKNFKLRKMFHAMMKNKSPEGTVKRHTLGGGLFDVLLDCCL